MKSGVHLDIPPFLQIIKTNRRALFKNALTEKSRLAETARETWGMAETPARYNPAEVPSRAV